MRRRRLVIAVIFAVMLVAYAIWCWMQPTQTPNQATATGTELKTRDPAKAPDAASSVTPLPKLDRPIEPKRDIVQRVLQNLNHKNIEFYGRVLDQNDQPVSGVNVYASVIYNTGMTAGTARKETIT